LLSESGEGLEIIVQKTLADLSIKTERTESGFPTDLISNEVAIEITGITGCLGVSSEKVNQVGRFKEIDKNKKIILIVNTLMNFSPKQREEKMSFSPEVAKYFEALSVCFMTTMTLFQLWKNVVSGKLEQQTVRTKVLAKVGELTMQDFK
jgi:hypothetical protein